MTGEGAVSCMCCATAVARGLEMRAGPRVPGIGCQGVICGCGCDICGCRGGGRAVERTVAAAEHAVA